MGSNNWNRNKYYIKAFQLMSQETLPGNARELLNEIQAELTADTKRNVNNYPGIEYVDVQQAIANMYGRAARRTGEF